MSTSVKPKHLWLHTDTALPTLLHEEAKARNMKVELGATMLLGAPIGTDREKMRALVMNAVGEQQRFFDLVLSQHLPAQEALTMLRLCTIPRLNYLSRTPHPSILEPAAQRFDLNDCTRLRSENSICLSRSSSLAA